MSSRSSTSSGTSSTTPPPWYPPWPPWLYPPGSGPNWSIPPPRRGSGLSESRPSSLRRSA
eukprot:170836-Prorocentrum_minimum.AAC.1